MTRCKALASLRVPVRSLGILVFFLWLSGAGSAFASAAGSDNLLPKLARFTHIEGTFKQQRFISVLSLPLESNGVFSYDRAEGITWQTLKPVENIVRIDPEKGVLTGQTEANLQVVSSSQVVAELFLNLLSGNLERLQGMFTVDEQPKESGWELVLHPRDRSLAEYINGIIITGNDLVESIVLQESNGDRSEISLQPTERH